MNFGKKLLQTSNRPVNIICVKTGSKYSNKHVERLYKMVERNCTLPFIFYCLTDDIYNLPKDVVGIGVDKSLDLESYWWKVCLFDLNFDETLLYIDLDVIIQQNIDYIFLDDNQNFKCILLEDAGIPYPFDGRDENSILVIPQVKINSSLMLFKPATCKYLFDEFIKNIDYNIIHYYGLDRFISEKATDLNYFDFTKDYYYRAKGQEYCDPELITKEKLIYDPNRTFCIMNQCLPEYYIGLEKYFI